jgi:hypothetical protein
MSAGWSLHIRYVQLLDKLKQPPSVDSVSTYYCNRGPDPALYHVRYLNDHKHHIGLANPNSSTSFVVLVNRR